MAWLLDTNVVSEARKRRADPNVVAWLRNHADDSQYLSVVTLGEIRQGIERLRLSDDNQARMLDAWLLDLILRFRSRILDVSEAVADRWGRLSPSAPMPDADGLIAATALHHGLAVVTRNVRDYRQSGVETVNPWGTP